MSLRFAHALRNAGLSRLSMYATGGTSTPRRCYPQLERGGGFSVAGSVRIAAADHAGRERLLRYCARSPFALDRLRELDPEHRLYKSTKPAGTGPLQLTMLQLHDCVAALVPPERIHRR